MHKADYIASDIHLGAVPRETERAFLRFLEHAGAEAARLLLPGDLFDFWFEWGQLVEGRHFRVLAALAEIVDAGVPVTMVGGNHDAWGGRFLTQEVGLTFATGELRLRLGGREALVAHGDGVGAGDLKYRVLKSVIRSRAAVAGFRLLHPELGLRLARRVSSTEAKAMDDPAHRGRARYIERWALEVLAARPELDLVVCGHAHLPAVVEPDPGRYYLNAGDWVTHRSYAVVPDGSPPELREWS
jgi:UDP-2,3-diacylglucosamine hydrolase